MKKFSKIMGVVVTIAMLASMIVASVPASAAPLSWTPEGNVPKTTGYKLGAAGIDVYDMAVNGDVIYAGTSNLTGGLYKSTDGGNTWTSLASTTFYPDAPITQVAVAPDNPDVVAISTNASVVYYSENGGAMWSNLGQPGSALNVNDIDVSVGPIRNVVAGGNVAGSSKMYTMMLAMAQPWLEKAVIANGFSAGNNTIAVKYSPNYQTDKIIGVVTTNATGTMFQVYWAESGLWNNQVTGYVSTPATYPITVDATVLATKASLAFPATYVGSDYSSRIVYVGYGSATAGGVYRLSDYSVSNPFTTWSGAVSGPVDSIAYHESGKLVVGIANSNRVYSCLAPTAIAPKYERDKVYKMPGGKTATLVAWSGDNVVAATSGAESGVSISTDDGVTFNDVALIDTTLNTIADTAVSADGSKLYMASVNLAGTGASVWVKESNVWTRVLSLTVTTTNLILRVAPDDPDVVYLAQLGTQNVWVSQDGGMEAWKAVPCYKVSATTGIVDMEIYDADTVYVLDNTGVSVTTNSGSSWGSKKSLDGLGVAYDLALAPNGDVLVGDTTGGIAYSKDAGATFTKIIAAVGGATPGNVVLAADTDYETNNTIYAACDGDGGIYRLAADKNAMAMSIYAPNYKTSAPALGAGANMTGMVMSGNVLYALVNGPVSSVLYRATNFQAAATVAAASWSYVQPAGPFAAVLLNKAAPNALKLSDGPTLWAVTSANALYSIMDPIAMAGPTLNSPVNDYVVPVNPESGNPYTVNFNVTRYASTSITIADLQIATDPDFVGLIVDTTSAVPAGSLAMGASDTAVFNVGPGAAFPITFNPANTYYWRARVGTATLNSGWSESRTFKIDQVESFATTNPVTGPALGAADIELLPTFTWAPYEGAIGYEVVLSEDPSFAIIEWSRNVDSNFYKVGADEALKYSTTYYWRVRGVLGESVLQGQTWVTPAGPWITGVFTTMAEPADEGSSEPIVITEPGETEVKIVEVPVTTAPVIPTYLLWIIVAVGAILIIALIVLIVRTRRIA